MHRPIAILALISVLTLVTSGISAAASITAEKYESITDGMTYDQVVAIMGGKGKETNRIEDAITYEWSALLANRSIVVTFRQGKVVSKFSIGNLKGKKK
jgi:hypothetical protein